MRLIEFKTAGELDATFSALAQQRPEALVVMSDAALYDLREPISALALRHRLPTIAYVPEFTDAGTLMSYGPPRRAMYSRAAHYVKKILSGVNPADLPVEQPTQVELSLNLRTAKALGRKRLASRFLTQCWRGPTAWSSRRGTASNPLHPNQQT